MTLAATPSPYEVPEALTELLRFIEREHQRIDILESEVQQLRHDLADEQQRRRVLSGRVDYIGWTG